MAVTRAKKEDVLKGLIDSFQKAKTIVFANCAGLTVKQFEDLRRTLRSKNIGCSVAKKTLMNLAAKESGITDLDTKKFEGALVAIFSYDDEIEGARIAHKFSKDNEVFVIRGGVADGAVHDSRYIVQLAQLPTKEELIAKLVYVIKSPISGFHGVLHGTIRGLAQVLKAHADKLGS
jgi:large subunit ribosomal protein L10